MLLTLFGISVLVFTMLRLVPGNIADIVFNAAGMIDVAEKAKLEKELGLDRPIAVQYVQWVSGLARGDLGYSYVSEKPAIQEILPRIPITAKLAGLALCFSILFGVPLGVLSAGNQSQRAFDSLLLARVAGFDGIGRLVWHYPDLYRSAARVLERACALLRASGGGWLSLFRTCYAANAFLNAGSAAAGLHPHRAR
jgi:peptide/nickel transport system permease protein